MLTCPNCKRKVFTRREMLCVTLDGAARCPSCGRAARLDMLSRWVVSCMVAILLQGILLYGNFFYSGHLLVVSLFIIFGAWRMLCYVALPLITLEALSSASLGRKGSRMILAALLVAATILDGFMASRFDAESVREHERSPATALRHDQVSKSQTPQ